MYMTELWYGPVLRGLARRSGAQPPVEAAMRRPSALVAALFVGALLLFLSPPATAAGSPTATFSKSSSWDGGYQGAYTVTNGGSTALSGWTVEFDLPSGTTVGSYWDALLTQSGSHYTFKNREYNGSL